MSENISNELPVITNIEDIPESAILELSGGREAEKPAKKATATKKSTKKSEEVAKDE